MIIILGFLMIIFTYFLGSIPTGYIIVKLLKGIDIREVGSGNIGATNVKRVMGIKWFFIVLFLDMLKGFVPVIISLKIFSYNSFFPAFVGMTSIIGHTFSVFLKFKGGKGVATGLGVFLALTPYSILTAIIVFIIILYIFRYVSLGSIIAVFLLPIFIFVYGESGYYNIVLVFSIIGSIFIIYKHKENIKRLINGKESKFELNKKEEKK